MTTPRTNILPAVIIGGACFTTMTLLLFIAYVPDFAPAAYHNLRHNGLISVVPAIIITGILLSVGMLRWECKNNQEKRRKQ